MNKPIWLPHLILQRNLGVKDLTTVNFKADLVEHSLKGSVDSWQPKEDKPNLEIEVQALDANDPRLDNKRGQIFDRGGREPFLVYEEYTMDKKTKKALIESIPVRGLPVDFVLLNYNTYLFETEYELIKGVVDRIEEITIQVTYGLSPIFKVLAKLKES